MDCGICHSSVCFWEGHITDSSPFLTFQMSICVCVRFTHSFNHTTFWVPSHPLSLSSPSLPPCLSFILSYKSLCNWILIILDWDCTVVLTRQWLILQHMLFCIVFADFSLMYGIWAELPPKTFSDERSKKGLRKCSSSHLWGRSLIVCIGPYNHVSPDIAKPIYWNWCSLSLLEVSGKYFNFPISWFKWACGIL